MTCYIERATEYGIDQYNFDSSALISHQYEPDSYVRILVFDSKLIKPKKYGFRQGDNVLVHYEKEKNSFDLKGRIDDINATFMTVMVKPDDWI
ncbi:hypothetical protein EFS28_09800 [Lactobacillus acidophilus]|uniref:hypothetical protein n=1 Tax=Lactobacillus acidophilus TaxID=1579 RepID=UPI0021A2648B|nr:hypothetical protein [Lactobacillus acidophilus]MCT3602245.1 hypothetical protein [Lactobacillus acidophilus]MCT3624484.1 hypothetical protein [Lactobacillus acidophilus]